MTNAQIIFNESCRLMEAGTIKSTGRTIKVQTADGETRTILEPEPLHTFQSWKELGYSVKKGEHARAKFPIWKYGTKKPKDGSEEAEQETGHCFMKMSFFFTFDQVEPLKNRAA